MSGHLACRGSWGMQQMVCHHIGQPWHMQDIVGAFSNERQLLFLPGRPRLCHPVEGSQEQLVVSPELKMAALYHKNA